MSGPFARMPWKHPLTQSEVRVGRPAVLVVAGGAMYLVGATCFALHWPMLRPTVFSFHEVWHVFTVVAAALQLTAIWILAT